MVITVRNTSLESTKKIVGTRLPCEAVKHTSAVRVEIHRTGEDAPKYPVERFHTLTTGTVIHYRKITLMTGVPVMSVQKRFSFRIHVNCEQHSAKAVQ